MIGSARRRGGQSLTRAILPDVACDTFPVSKNRKFNRIPELSEKINIVMPRQTVTPFSIAGSRMSLSGMHAAQDAAVLNPRFQENIATTACRFSLPAPVSGNSVAGRMCLGTL